jgi:predicted RNA methylase
MASDRFEALAAGYARVVIDVGAGDGRFAFQLAQAQPDTLVIAVEPDRARLEKLSARAAKPPAAGGAANILFVADTLAEAAKTIVRAADEVLATLPSGRLLSGLLHGDGPTAGALASMGRKGARIKIVINARADAKARDLPAITPLYTRDVIAPAFAARGAKVRVARWLTDAELAKVGTTWAERLAQEPASRTFYIEARVTDRTL